MPICGAVQAFIGLRVALTVAIWQGRQGIVYLLACINMVFKTRLHHIENGHKYTSALGFDWASRSAPFCVLRKFPFCEFSAPN
jgi:hypothetical protein